MVLGEKRADLAMSLAAGATLVALAILAPGTGDDGDSVQHFLFSKWAFTHPENFFHHWAKPVFVMLSAPAAQFGFTGIKVFNAALLAFQIWLLLKIASEFGMKNCWLLPVFSLAAPMNLTHTLSGLTEPLFAVWLAGPMLLLLRGKKGWAYVLWSFLPLVRSEGLVIFCPLIIYMVWRGDWRWLPALVIGHVAIGLAGIHWHTQWHWVVSQIPYANFVNEAYGKGTWPYFAQNMPVVIGSTLTVLLMIGLVDGLFRLILNKNWLKPGRALDEAWLVFGLFVAYFLAHTAFWALGIFNSFGMLRVMVGVMPCIALICLCGANRLFSTAFLWVKNPGARLALTAVLPVFLVWRTANRLEWQKDFGLTPAQLAVSNAAKAIRADFPNFSEIVLISEFSDVYRQLGLDYFDEKKALRAAELFNGKPLPPNTVIVFDEWYMGRCSRLPLGKLQTDPRFVERGVFESGLGLPGGDPKIRVFYADSTQLGVAGLIFKNPLDTFGAELGGRRCLKLDEKYQFSPNFTAKVGDFGPGDDLLFSFEICQPDTVEPSPASLVFQVESAGEIYVYHVHDLKEGLRGARGEWASFRFLEELPEAKTPGDRVSAYLWNPGKRPVFLKNFEARLRLAE